MIGASRENWRDYTFVQGAGSPEPLQRLLFADAISTWLICFE